jgi:hypothetical protein
MALRLLASSENIRRNKGNSNAKLATTPHRRNKVMVEQVRARNNWKLGGTYKIVHEKLQVDIQAANIDRRSQGLHTAV